MTVVLVCVAGGTYPCSRTIDDGTRVHRSAPTAASTLSPTASVAVQRPGLAIWRAVASRRVFNDSFLTTARLPAGARRAVCFVAGEWSALGFAHSIPSIPPTALSYFVSAAAERAAAELLWHAQLSVATAPAICIIWTESLLEIVDVG